MFVRVFILSVALGATAVAAPSRKTANPASHKALAAAEALANDAVQASGRGDFNTAVELFSRAISMGALPPKEQAMALVERGKSHEALDQLSAAEDDYKRASASDPGNDEAAQKLRDVDGRLREQADSAARRAALAPPPPDQPFGVLSSLAGRCYWYERPGQQQHDTYAKATWIIPQKSMSFEVRTKTDQSAVEQFTRGDNGAIVFSGFAGQAEIYGTLQVGVALAIGREWRNNEAIRTYIASDGSTGFSLREQTHVQSSWRDSGEIHLTAASAPELISAGLIKPKKSCP